MLQLNPCFLSIISNCLSIFFFNFAYNSIVIIIHGTIQHTNQQSDGKKLLFAIDFINGKNFYSSGYIKHFTAFVNCFQRKKMKKKCIYASNK